MIHEVAVMILFSHTLWRSQVREGCVREGDLVREGNVWDTGVCARPHVQGALGVDDIPANKKMRWGEG